MSTVVILAGGKQGPEQVGEGQPLQVFNCHLDAEHGQQVRLSCVHNAGNLFALGVW